MDRRAFIGTLAGGLLAAPVTVEAQQTRGVYRIGWLSSASPTAPGVAHNTEAFRSALRELGYVEGQNAVLELRWGDGTPDRLSQSATELARLKMHVIVAIGPPAIRAARQATITIPIVMMTSGDPVRLGFVESLGRPGGNVTGVSFLGEQLSGKLLELLREVLPRASRVAVLWNPTNGAHESYLREVRTAAASLGVTVGSVEVRSSEDFAPAFARMIRERADALILLLDYLFTANVQVIAELAAKNRLPTIYGVRELADAGGLMAYGPNLAELARRAAIYVDKILKGAKPADLPVEQPTKFELIINLKTAKSLGLTIPQSLLQQADQLIE